VDGCAREVMIQLYNQSRRYIVKVASKVEEQAEKTHEKGDIT
jgi:hypothetical protein